MNGRIEVYKAELAWFTQVLNSVISRYLGQEVPKEEVAAVNQPPIYNNEVDSFYGQLVIGLKLSIKERTALALCLTAMLQPRLLDIFFVKNASFDRPFTEFGGWVAHKQGPFMPTGTTLLFILSGADLQKQLEARQLLLPESTLLKEGVLILGKPTIEGDGASGLLQLSPRYTSELIYNQPYRPQFSTIFPAQLLTVERQRKELILPEATERGLNQISHWITQEKRIMKDWNMASRLRPGYRSFFYGPPGTGKTMAATLIGQEVGFPVYRVDLSLVVSKYIGETEKNLSNVFQQAEYQKWILFFDEADALFGKRTEIKDAHDRYANQEVAYLLQRIESFNGILILASNLRSNVDDAFTRRFESIIYFPMPNAALRQRLWEQSFPKAKGLKLETVLIEALPDMAQRYELSGGSIMNVARYALLAAANRDKKKATVLLEDTLAGIRIEYGKEGRSL